MTKPVCLYSNTSADSSRKERMQKGTTFKSSEEKEKSAFVDIFAKVEAGYCLFFWPSLSDKARVGRAQTLWPASRRPATGNYSFPLAKAPSWNWGMKFLKWTLQGEHRRGERQHPKVWVRCSLPIFGVQLSQIFCRLLFFASVLLPDWLVSQSPLRPDQIFVFIL